MITPYSSGESALGGGITAEADVSVTGIAVTVVEGLGPALISENLIGGASKGAILGMLWKEIATDDLSRTGAAEYPHPTVARNRVD